MTTLLVIARLLPDMDATPEIEPLVTVRSAARMLGVGRHVLYRAGDAGELAIYDAGGWARVRPSDVLAWLEQRRRRSERAA